MNAITMWMRNRLSNRGESIDKNLTGCLQRYLVLQYERMIKYLILNTNNAAFEIILREHDFDFHRTDRDLHSSIFSDFWTIKFVQFSYKIRMIVTHDNIQKANRGEYHWRQWSIMRQTYTVNMNNRSLRMRNRLSKRHERTKEDMTDCLQRYVVLQYERMIKYLILNTSTVALEIIFREHDFDFHWTVRDIHISTFFDFWAIKFVQFSHKIKMIVTQDRMKKAKRCEYHWQ
jgi:hypothetical protein